LTEGRKKNKIRILLGKKEGFDGKDKYFPPRTNSYPLTWVQIVSATLKMGIRGKLR